MRPVENPNEITLHRLNLIMSAAEELFSLVPGTKVRSALSRMPSFSYLGHRNLYNNKLPQILTPPRHHIPYISFFFKNITLPVLSIDSHKLFFQLYIYFLHAAVAEINYHASESHKNALSPSHYNSSPLMIQLKHEKLRNEAKRICAFLEYHIVPHEQFLLPLIGQHPFIEVYNTFNVPDACDWMFRDFDDPFTQDPTHSIKRETVTKIEDERAVKKEEHIDSQITPPLQDSTAHDTLDSSFATSVSSQSIQYSSLPNRTIWTQELATRMKEIYEFRFVRVSLYSRRSRITDSPLRKAFKSTNNSPVSGFLTLSAMEKEIISKLTELNDSLKGKEKDNKMSSALNIVAPVQFLNNDNSSGTFLRRIRDLTSSYPNIDHEIKQGVNRYLKDRTARRGSGLLNDSHAPVPRLNSITSFPEISATIQLLAKRFFCFMESTHLSLFLISAWSGVGGREKLAEYAAHNPYRGIPSETLDNDLNINSLDDWLEAMKWDEKLLKNNLINIITSALNIVLNFDRNNSAFVGIEKKADLHDEGSALLDERKGLETALRKFYFAAYSVLIPLLSSFEAKMLLDKSNKIYTFNCLLNISYSLIELTKILSNHKMTEKVYISPVYADESRMERDIQDKREQESVIKREFTVEESPNMSTANMKIEERQVEDNQARETNSESHAHSAQSSGSLKLNMTRDTPNIKLEEHTSLKDEQTQAQGFTFLESDVHEPFSESLTASRSEMQINMILEFLFDVSADKLKRTLSQVCYKQLYLHAQFIAQYNRLTRETQQHLNSPLLLSLFYLRYMPSNCLMEVNREFSSVREDLFFSSFNDPSSINKMNDFNKRILENRQKQISDYQKLMEYRSSIIFANPLSFVNRNYEEGIIAEETQDESAERALEEKLASNAYTLAQFRFEHVFPQNDTNDEVRINKKVKDVLGSNHMFDTKKSSFRQEYTLSTYLVGVRTSLRMMVTTLQSIYIFLLSSQENNLISNSMKKQ